MSAANQSRNARWRTVTGEWLTGDDIIMAYEMAVAGGLELDAADDAYEMAEALENYGLVEFDDSYSTPPAFLKVQA